MYNSNNKQFVFKQASGRICNFYCDNKHNLCFSTLTKRNTWSNPSIIYKNIHTSLYADIDCNDCFHLLFQDDQGNIFYSKLENDSKKILPVLKSKTPSAYNKFLYLVPMRNNIHFFYVLEHNNSSILAHQILNEDKVSIPKVIDYVAKNDSPYCVVCDKSDNMYVFYQSSDGKNMQIGHKKYISSQNFWSDFTPVTRYNGDSEFPKTIMDSKDIMHICYQRRSSRHYELVYQQKIPDKNIWADEIIIHTSTHSFDEASIIIISDKIIIYWIRDDNIYYNFSNDAGNTWGKPSKYNFAAGKQLLCISYKTNNPYEMQKISIRDIPGIFVNGIKLAFYQNASNSSDNMSADELKNMIVDSLQLLKASIEELKESDLKLKEDISRLASSQQSLERELTKYTLKLDLVENQLNKIKIINNKMESLKNDINEFKSKMEISLYDLQKLNNINNSEIPEK